MTDLERLMNAVNEMRAAQKLEWDALPANFRIWKRARQQQRVNLLEQQVDALLQELGGAQTSTGKDEGGPAGA